MNSIPNILPNFFTVEFNLSTGFYVFVEKIFGNFSKVFYIKNNFFSVI